MRFGLDKSFLERVQEQRTAEQMAETRVRKNRRTNSTKSAATPPRRQASTAPAHPTIRQEIFANGRRLKENTDRLAALVGEARPTVSVLEQRLETEVRRAKAALARRGIPL